MTFTTKAFGSIRRLLFASFLCTALLVWSSPSEAQTDDDDDDMSGGALAVLLLAVGQSAADLEDFLPPSAPKHVDDLQAAIEGAAEAEAANERARELTFLGKAGGAAKALIGMTSACDVCDQLRADLQEILGAVARERATIAGASRSCRPNGVIDKWEECDPLALTTGCGSAEFCDDECDCEIP
jgi:hypothetical protein